MIKKYLGIICLFALVMSACSKGEVITTSDEVYPVLIHAQIQNILDNQSRANIGIDGTGTFEDGDVISLLCNNSQYNLILNNGIWNSNLDWNKIGQHATFSCFYPSQSNIRTNFKHTIATDQSDGKGFEQSDLLFASTSDVNKGEDVNLSFRHLMGCITVNLKGNKYSQSDIQNATVELRAYNEIYVSSDGTLGELQIPTNMPVIKLAHKGGGTFQAVICPQNMNVSHSELYPWLRITVKGKQYNVVTPPNNGNITIFSGKNLSLNYSLDERKPNPEIGGKFVFVNGVNVLEPSISNGWTSIPPTSDPMRLQLSWGKGSGWYDVNKMRVADNNLCWAATASNMLHWWLDQNSSNIARYCQIENISYAQIPHSISTSHDSEIFAVFKRSFKDDGGYIDRGLGWYFTKKYIQGDGASLEDSENGGYFTKVFGDNTSFVKRIGISNRRSLTQALKSAFSDGKSIGLEIRLSGYAGAGHAMTIWGAQFDEYGDVTAIVYCDNDDGLLGDYNPYGMMVSRVKEVEGVVYMQNSSGGFSSPIVGIVLLGTGQSFWTTYFANNSK